MADNQRKTKIVNPHYQYRTAFTAVLVAIIVVNLVIMAGALMPETVAWLFQQVRTTYYFIAIAEVVLIYLFWRYTIGATHRIAGPVYAIDRELKRFREGDLRSHVELRPRDEFRDVADSINTSVAGLRDEIRVLKQCAAALESELTAENVDRLRQALDRLKTDESEGSEPDLAGRE